MGTNRYAYSQQDPINKSDPNGHVAGEPDFTFGLAGIGRIIGGWLGGLFGGTAGGVFGTVAGQGGTVLGVGVGVLVEVPEGTATGATEGGLIGAGIDMMEDKIAGGGGTSRADVGSSSDSSGTAGEQNVPTFPTDLVGKQDGKGRRQGNRHNSGPLDEANGGTGDIQRDFDKLTGEQNGPANSSDGFPPGTMIGGNGITMGPGRNGNGGE